jgi:hypothetical protein
VTSAKYSFGKLSGKTFVPFPEADTNFEHPDYTREFTLARHATKGAKVYETKGGWWKGGEQEWNLEEATVLRAVVSEFSNIAGDTMQLETATAVLTFSDGYYGVRAGATRSIV